MQGTIQIDKIYPGVGRIQLRSGTTKMREVKAIRVALDKLWTTGRHDILQQVKRGTLKPLTLLSADLQGKTKSLRTAESIIPLNPGAAEKSTLVQWLEKQHLARTTKVAYRACIQVLHKFCSTTTTVGDLPEILARMQVSYEKERKARTFNQTRAMLLAYAREATGKYSDLWTGIRNVKQLKVTAKGEGHRLTVPQVLDVVERMGAELGGMFLSMVISGMGWTEFTVNGWDVEDDHVVIHGEKRTARDRVVPKVGEILPPTHQYKAFRKGLRKAGRAAKVGLLVPYDARRTFAKWMEAARIRDTHCDAYMGHEGKDMRSLYRGDPWHHEVREDGERLRQYILDNVPEGVRLPRQLVQPNPNAKEFFL